MNPQNTKHPTMLPHYPKTNTTTTTTTMTEIWTRLASTLASFMFIWAMFSQFIPYELKTRLDKCLTNLFSQFHPYVEITIFDSSEDRFKRSEAYSVVQSYLSFLSSLSAKRLRGEIGVDGTNIVLSLDDYQKVEDEFQGAKIWWVSGKKISSNHRGTFTYHDDPQGLEKRFFKVSFHKKHRDLVTGEYLKYVVKQGKEIKAKNRQRRLYTNAVGHFFFSGITWSHVPFEHPATFETLAMDPHKKREIIDDLVRFSTSQDFYSRIGKAWKRGYLLFGPPGTGKSTMIAAMANFLKYDVYDLELTAVRDNTELRKLLIETKNKSIIVIEDIDCSLDLTGQRKKAKTEEQEEEKSSATEDEEEKEKKRSKKGEDKSDENEKKGSKVTLSGLLNFIDGIWSSCGGERIIVFTTNYVEKLDPALIRRGRMDKHIEMSYCGFEGFKVLAKNYLFVDDHAMFDVIKRLLNEVELTPADVAENLLSNSSKEDVDKCFDNLVVALEEAKKEKARKKRVEEEEKREKEKEMEMEEKKKRIEFEGNVSRIRRVGEM